MTQQQLFVYSSFRGLQEQAQRRHSGQEPPRARPCSSSGTTACPKDRPRVFRRCHHPQDLPAAQGGGSGRLILPSPTDATGSLRSTRPARHTRARCQQWQIKVLAKPRTQITLSLLGKQVIVSALPSAEPVHPRYEHTRDVGSQSHLPWLPTHLPRTPQLLLASDLSGAAFLATA